MSEKRVKKWREKAVSRHLLKVFSLLAVFLNVSKLFWAENSNFKVISTQVTCVATWHILNCADLSFRNGRNAATHCKDTTVYRKFEINIPRKGTARPQSQFLHSCFCERFIHSHDRSAYSATGKNVDPIVGTYKSLTDK